MFIPYITFKKDGAYVVDQDTQEMSTLKDLDISMMALLGKRAIIEEGVTLRQFMEAFISEADMLDVVFTHVADRHTPVTDMINFLQSDKMREDVYEDDPPIEYLEVRWPAIDSDYCAQVPDFGGVGFNEDGSPTYYAVSYTPINELRDLPLIINAAQDIYDLQVREYQNSALSEYNNTEEELEKLFSTKFSVYRDFRVKDVLEAIIYDMTFSGMAVPGERHDIMNMIDTAMNEIERGDHKYTELDELLDKTNDDE